MTDYIRQRIAAVCAFLLAILMGVGFADIPPAGDSVTHYGRLLTELAVTQQNTLNTVSGVLFDLRALDTLGEALVIFISSAGLNVLLQILVNETHQGEPQWNLPERPLYPISDAVRTVCLSVVTIIAIYGVYLTVRGHLSVGGGFHGGVVIVTAIVFIYLAGKYKVKKKIGNEQLLENLDSIGIGGYVIVGLVGLIVTGAFLANFLPLGTTGDLFSAGIIPILSILVAMEAVAAVGIIIINLQEQLIEREQQQ